MKIFDLSEKLAIKPVDLNNVSDTRKYYMLRFFYYADIRNLNAFFCDKHISGAVKVIGDGITVVLVSEQELSEVKDLLRKSPRLTVFEINGAVSREEADIAVCGKGMSLDELLKNGIISEVTLDEVLNESAVTEKLNIKPVDLNNMEPYSFGKKQLETGDVVMLADRTYCMYVSYEDLTGRYRNLVSIDMDGEGMFIHKESGTDRMGVWRLTRYNDNLTNRGIRFYNVLAVWRPDIRQPFSKNDFGEDFLRGCVEDTEPIYKKYLNI